MKKLLFLALSLSFFSNTYAQMASDLVISEVYPGGNGSSMADFVELYNPTGSSISLEKMRLKYKNALGATANQSFSLPSGKSVAAYSYFLVAIGSGFISPAADATSTSISNLAATGGHVVLMRDDDAINHPVWGAGLVVDLLAWGNANTPEGSAVPAPSGNSTIERKAYMASTASTMSDGGSDQYKGNAFDSNNNATDFIHRVQQEPQTAASERESGFSPIFLNGFPTVSSTTTSRIIFSVRMEYAGRVYYVVLPEGQTAPSAAQVIGGQRADGNAALIKGSFATGHSTTNKSYGLAVDGLSAATAYAVYLVAESGLIKQNTVTKLQATTEGVLPVSFGEISAKRGTGNQLEVSWRTLSEKDNSHFVLQASVNGSQWTDLGKVASRGNGGNSSSILEYSMSVPMAAASLAGIGFLGLLLLPAGRGRWSRLVVCALMVCLAISCAKEKEGQQVLEKLDAKQTVYVRVAQVDLDGSISYSRTVAVK